MVDMHKSSHDELTVKPIHDPSMTRNSVSKVLQDKIGISTSILGLPVYMNAQGIQVDKRL